MHLHGVNNTGETRLWVEENSEKFRGVNLCIRNGIHVHNHRRRFVFDSFCGRFVVEKITFNTLGKCAASLSRDVERRKFQLKPIYNDWVACFVG